MHVEARSYRQQPLLDMFLVHVLGNVGGAGWMDGVAGQPLLQSLGHLVAWNRGSQCGREVFIANRLLTCVFLNRVETLRNV